MNVSSTTYTLEEVIISAIPLVIADTTNQPRIGLRTSGLQAFNDLEWVRKCHHAASYYRCHFTELADKIICLT